MEKQVASLAAEVARLRAVGANAATRPAKTEEENLAAFREVIERLQDGNRKALHVFYKSGGWTPRRN